MLNRAHSVKQFHNLSLGDVGGEVSNIPVEGEGSGLYCIHTQGMHCIVSCVWSAVIPHTALLLLKDGCHAVSGGVYSEQSSTLGAAYPMAVLGGGSNSLDPAHPMAVLGEGPTHYYYHCIHIRCA